MAGFLHGIQVTEVSNGGVIVQVVNSAVIGLVGSAPQWLAPTSGVSKAPGVSVPTLVTSQSTAAGFGPKVLGYTIPYALDAIQQQGAGAAIVVDVFNPAVHFTAVAATAVTGPASNLVPVFLGHMGLIGPGLPNYGTLATTVIVTNAAGSITYVEGTDYTVDYVNGLLYTKVGGTITVSEALKVTLSYCDPSKVVSADIVGTVVSGVYTGLQGLLATFNTMGFFAKILIAPGFTDLATSSALVTMAGKIRAIAITDAPPATSVAACIANRGTVGSTFNQASYRLLLAFPYEYFFDTGIVPTGILVSPQGVYARTLVNANADGPYCSWMAGAIANKDQTNGFWFSPSNTVMQGVVGPDISIYASAFDPNSDTNVLNAAGITTVFNGFGTGLRVWGNRSSAFPSNADITTFVSVRRTLDVVEQSIQVSALPFLDQPISNGLINSILTSVNAFLRSLIQQGALVGGAITYNPADNPQLNLAAGQLVFEVGLVPPPPAEEITFLFYVNTALLAQLGPTVSAANSSAQVLPTA